MSDKKGNVSGAELEVLKALWSGGPGTVRDVAARLSTSRQGRAYTTLQTLLNRLQAKGCVTTDKGRLPHVYRASVTREGLVRESLDDLAGRLFEGATTPLVMALISNRKYTAKEIEGFRKLLDEAESKK